MGAEPGPRPAEVRGPSSVTTSISGVGKPTVVIATAPTSVPVSPRRFARSTTSWTGRVSNGASGRSHGWPSRDCTASQGALAVPTNAAAVGPGFTRLRVAEVPFTSMSAVGWLQATGAAAGAAESTRAIGTLSVAEPEATVTAVFTGWASAVTYRDVTEISCVAPGGSVNVAGAIANPESAHCVVAVTGSVPPLRTVNDVPAFTPVADTSRASGAGSDTRTSEGLATVPTVTFFGGDQGPTLPHDASARTSNT